MANIKKLLNKKGWTGQELGIIEVTNMAVMYKQQVTGEPVKPIVTAEQFQKMVNTIESPAQGNIYNGYLSIHDWISLNYNIAQSNMQRAQLRYKTLLLHIVMAEMAEDTYDYIADLPLIMTEKQYNEEVNKRREEWLSGKADSVLNLIYRAIEYYIELLTAEPKKANPLKPIRKKYLAAAVTSPIILSRYNEATDNGYYILEDGRRSDQMTEEEWQEAITTPKMADTLSRIRTEQQTDEVGATASKLAMQRTINEAKIIYAGGTREEAQAAQQKADYEAGLAIPSKWHLYEEPPAELTKWEVLEDACTCYEIYKKSLSGEAETAEEYTAEAKDFVNEFKEAVDAIIKDIDSKFFKDIKGLAELPIEEWATTSFDWKQLYDKDFYGFREEADRIDILFDGNKRAVFNGIAVLKPTILSERNADENGYYKPPKIRESFVQQGLQGFFPEAEDYAFNVEEVEESREIILDSYYYLKGYNTALDLIAKHFSLPDIAIFKMDIDTIAGQIDALNDLVPVLYQRIAETTYEDTELKQRKLQVLQDIFTEIDYKSLTIPEENIAELKRLFDDFACFRDMTIAELLCFRNKDNPSDVVVEV